MAKPLASRIAPALAGSGRKQRLPQHTSHMIIPYAYTSLACKGESLKNEYCPEQKHALASHTFCEHALGRLGAMRCQEHISGLCSSSSHNQPFPSTSLPGPLSSAPQPTRTYPKLRGKPHNCFLLNSASLPPPPPPLSPATPVMLSRPRVLHTAVCRPGSQTRVCSQHASVWTIQNHTAAQWNRRMHTRGTDG